MKKHYFKPTTQTIHLEAEPLMLNASANINIPVTDGTDEQTITGSAPDGTDPGTDPGYWTPW